MRKSREAERSRVMREVAVLQAKARWYVIVMAAWRVFWTLARYLVIAIVTFALSGTVVELIGFAAQ